MVKGMRILCIALGFVFLAAGCVGVALPILPTTPFLLLAAFCFARGSARLDAWFKGTTLYQNNLASFVRGEGMPWKAKLRIMGTVTVIMAIAFLAMRRTTVGRICLVVVWVCHIIAFCFFIKTRPAEPPEGRREPLAERGEAACHDDQ